METKSKFVDLKNLPKKRVEEPEVWIDEEEYLVDKLKIEELSAWTREHILTPNVMNIDGWNK